MADLLTAADRAAFKAAMKDAHDTFANKEITWKRLRSKLDRWGEDNNDNGYDNVTLKVLINYNYMRSWPITFQTESGGLDRQSVQVLIHKDYLRGLGFINADNYFAYNEVDDRFIIDGLVHAPFGDTPASEFSNDDIWIVLILKREETQTGDKR